MTSSRLISCAISGRLNEYELRPSLILTPGLRLTSPDARAAAGVKAKADEAIAIERVRNARRKVCPSMKTSGVGPVYTRSRQGWNWLPYRRTGLMNAPLPATSHTAMRAHCQFFASTFHRKVWLPNGEVPFKLKV